MNLSAAGSEHLRDLEVALEHGALAVVVTNARREIEWVNSVYSDLTGWTLAEVKGKNPRSFLHGTGTSGRATSRLGARLRSGQPVRDFEMLNYKKSGEPYWVSLDIRPVVDPNGEVTRYVALERDITQRKRAELEAARTDRLRADGYRLAGLASLHHDITTGIAHCSVEFFELLGISRASLDLPMLELLKYVHPDDADTARLRYERAINNHDTYDMEFRLITAGGAAKWVRARGVLDGWDDGHSASFRLVFQDISDRRGAEAPQRSPSTPGDAGGESIDVLARVSHDLRIPLRAIIRFAAAVERADSTRISERSRGALTGIQESAIYLSQLADDLLDWGRLQAGHASVDIAPMDLLAVVRKVQSLAQPLAAERGVSIRVTEPVVALHALGDHRRLTQVLVNLVGNAVDYNRAHGRVEISVKQLSNGFAAIAVADTGVGIADIDLPHVFDPFNRLAVGGARAGTAKDSGGLGLAISRRLAREMGGDIVVESSLGAGSTFVVTLPGAQARSTATAEDAWQGRARITILHIEDDESNGSMIETCLQSRPGFDLVCASSGVAGLAMAKRIRPAVVIVTIELGDMAGHELARQLMADPNLRDTLCIAVSEDAGKDAVERSMRSGFREHLSKPLAPDQLLDALDRCLGAQGSPARH